MSTIFSEDNSPISESESSEDNSTLTYAARVTTKRKFKFRNFQDTKKRSGPSPTSSPLHGWPEEIIISSDEDLETSMVEIEKQVSLEMSELE